MDMTDLQRRWWFATRPEFSWSRPRMGPKTIESLKLMRLMDEWERENLSQNTPDRIMLAGPKFTPYDSGIFDISRMAGGGGASVGPSRATAGAARGPSYRNLWRNMRQQGTPKPPDHATHHIVPENDSRFEAAKEARKLLEKFGIKHYDPANGVNLPNGPGVGEGADHRSLHTKVYYREVEKLLRKATSKEHARKILKGIGQKLLKSEFPK